MVPFCSDYFLNHLPVPTLAETGIDVPSCFRFVEYRTFRRAKNDERPLSRGCINRPVQPQRQAFRAVNPGSSQGGPDHCGGNESQRQQKTLPHITIFFSGCASGSSLSVSFGASTSARAWKVGSWK